jgi:hypothetical protein
MSLLGSAQRGTVARKERPCLHYGGNLCTGFGSDDTTCWGCGWDRADHGVSDERLRQRGYTIPKGVIEYEVCPCCGQPMYSDEELLAGWSQPQHFSCPPDNFERGYN